jgi:hypothetical protein
VTRTGESDVGLKWLSTSLLDCCVFDHGGEEGCGTCPSHTTVTDMSSCGREGISPQ